MTGRNELPGAATPEVAAGAVPGATRVERLDSSHRLRLRLTIEYSWGGDIVTAAVSHLAAGIAADQLFAVSFMDDWTLEHAAGYEPRSEGGWGPGR